MSKHVETLMTAIATGNVVIYDESGAAWSLNNDDRRLVAEALEKQIPKKPDSKYVFRQNDNVCPVCETKTTCRILFKWEKFCPDCGQAIDWREVEG